MRELLCAHVQAQRRVLGPDATVDAPAGCDESLWIDLRLVDACNELHHLWKLVDKRCAMKCGDQPLRAGPRKYAWDGPDGDDPNVCARDYVHNTFASAKAGFADRSISPAPDAPKGHPDGFRPFAKRTCTRLVRVWAHTYHNLFATFVEQGCHVAANVVFKRFLVFALRFELVDPAELDPIADLVRNLLRPRQASATRRRASSADTTGTSAASGDDQDDESGDGDGAACKDEAKEDAGL